MGDRCYLSMTFRASDLGAVEEVLEKAFECIDDDTSEPSLVTATIEEANYALEEERFMLAEAGIPFYGHHSEGGGYGAYSFAASGDGEMHQVPNFQGGEVIAVYHDIAHATVAIDAEGIQKALEYFCARAEAQEAMKSPAPTPAGAAFALADWLGYRLNEEWRGQRIATEATASLCWWLGYSALVCWGQSRLWNDPLTHPDQGPTDRHIAKAVAA